ncbi:MAG: hypothetical protein LBL46_02750 [Rickettsiales bacterium]|nr:hypothetical protein [Rickettsiales bacterium]
MKNQISNEQLAMSNGNARKSNNKILLLIAHCALLITGGGEADAAKLCVLDRSGDLSNSNGAIRASNMTDDLSGMFFAGIDCQGYGWTDNTEMDMLKDCDKLTTFGYAVRNSTEGCVCQRVYPSPKRRVINAPGGAIYNQTCIGQCSNVKDWGL